MNFFRDFGDSVAKVRIKFETCKKKVIYNIK